MLVVEFELRTVVELGVRSGNSTLALLAGVSEIDGTVLSIDRDPCEHAKAAVAKNRLGDYWIFIRGEALGNLAVLTTAIDLLFVDLDHTFDETAEILELYAPLVRPGGWMAFHDTITRPNVLYALEPFRAIHDDWRFYHWEHNSGLMLCRRQS